MMEVKHDGISTELPMPRNAAGRYRFATIVELGFDERPDEAWLKEQFIDGIDSRISELQSEFTWVRDSSIGTVTEVTS